MRAEDADPFSPDDFIPKYSSQPKTDDDIDQAVKADLLWVEGLVSAGMIHREVQ